MLLSEQKIKKFYLFSLFCNRALTLKIHSGEYCKRNFFMNSSHHVHLFIGWSVVWLVCSSRNPFFLNRVLFKFTAAFLTHWCSSNHDLKLEFCYSSLLSQQLEQLHQSTEQQDEQLDQSNKQTDNSSAVTSIR